VEIEITPEEGVAVLQAHRNMSGFPVSTMTPKDYPNSPLTFSPNPNTPQCSVDKQFAVYATAEIFGVAFSQGVNEMQTLANMSSSRDVFRQVEINQGAIARLEEYYGHYKTALMHQLDQRKPDLLECLMNPAGPAGPAGPDASAGSGGPGRAGAGVGRKVPSASFMGPPTISAGGSGAAKLQHTSSIANFMGLRRRKSLRESVSGDDQLLNTANTLATKVVTFNDRYVSHCCHVCVCVCV
jgi:hypothetical protein